MSAPRWVLTPLVAICLVAYGNVVSGVGLLVWVLPSALIAAAVVALTRIVAPAAARLAVWPALAVTTIAWSGLVELLSGQTSGPVTRSSLLVGGLTGAMAAILLTRHKAAVLVPATAMLAGALALGAAGRILEITSLFAVASAWTLLRVGPYRPAELRDRQRVLPIAGILLLAGFTTIAGTALAAKTMGSPWEIPGASANGALTRTTLETPDVEPSAKPTAEPSPSPTPSATPTPSASAIADPFETTGNDVIQAIRDTVLPALRNVAFALIALLLLWLLLNLIWRLWVTTRWIATKRRLARGAARDRVVGAWSWVRLRLDQAGRHLPPSASPDVVASGFGLEGYPARLREDLSRLAALTSAAGFSAGDQSTQSRAQVRDANRAWALARDVEASLRRWRSARQWWSLTAKRPDTAGVTESARDLIVTTPARAPE